MKKILVAGIGNVFYGDDAFGCDVIRRLLYLDFPPEVTIMDFGIRSFDLVYALTDGYDATILVDAVPRGEKPGTIFLLEPDLEHLEELGTGNPKAHAMNPLSILQMAKTVGDVSAQLYLVGCQPAVLENDEIGLSAPVRAAIAPTVKIIQSLVNNLKEEIPVAFEEMPGF